MISSKIFSSHTCVSIKTDGGQESFPTLKDIKGERDFGTFSFLLDAKQSSLQVEPEADLLQGSS